MEAPARFTLDGGGAQRPPEKASAWLRGEVGEDHFRHVMGFNADEERRVLKDRSFSTSTRHSEYPLVTWGWGREACEDYIEQVTGVRWQKSCCTFCPFACNSKGLSGHLERWRRQPEAASQALWLEHAALALNPEMKLFASRTAREVVETMPDNEEVLTTFAGMFGEADEADGWALYRVRRVYRGPANGVRSVEVVSKGGRLDVQAHLSQVATENGSHVVTEAGSMRCWVRRRSDAYPSAVEMYVLAPLVAEPKVNPQFVKAWTSATSQCQLFAA